MRALPDSVNHLIEGFSRFPGIGKKTAQRMAFFLLKTERQLAVSLAKSILEMKDRVHACPLCHNISETSPCGICTDPKRDETILCVVEDATDLLSLEKTSEFRGKYHVLGGVISPLDGIGPDDLHVDSLLERLEGVKEVLIATNPSAQGETTALYLAKILKPKGVKVSRLARGIPMGGDLEYSDEATIVSALEGRVSL
ncbi:MAG: recombination mediator RecR [Candidatus Marinimicrobia bacterium]|jgi:recombination protein RecR|nr:recombination protein RecR [Candidatus Neomarinimicrobiota bacterium]MDP6397228.1 recombination mediator RecR [Candidatus Neomarinimicrobiota bacterium]MDP7026029.1 recombination mediator RecR [Candidatus Neomarinimicrobiota bacterium]MDP7558423.1 recombination mediator RecR [Candidatus Neomarinimicrobiota bacterium]MDP7654321.1 recombination mediator RecR [Candidatus Neomarinimicrobiota bacterium]|tara:strand:+ start:3487 stop:4080 length:594 start_codon:yes stop_codon:yes gene_type:complete